MFTHMVMFRFPDRATTDAVQAKLHELADVLGEIDELIVGIDELGEDRSYDLGMLMRFADRDAFERYNDHPVHVEAATWIDQVATEAVSVDWTD